VPLRIAFDLDGVLANLDSALVRQAEGLFGESMTRRLDVRAENPDAAKTADARTTEDSGDPPDSSDPGSIPGINVSTTARLNMSSRRQRRLWRHVESVENFWGTLEEIEPGSVRRLAAIATDLRWEVIFLTKRPETAGATAQVQTQRWLESHGFALPSVYVVQGSRGRIAAALALDIVVDDRPENCLDVVVDSKARAILVWRDDENQLPTTARRLGIGVVKTVGECLDILTQVDSGDGREPGVLDRVMRLLGLKKEPATL
jgi:hypothetical protein